jgi:HIV Tat-specific factor 1
VFAHNPDGVCTVQFKTAEAAQACITLMHGRWFGGQQVVAALWDGQANYHVQKTETEAEQALRLERYAAELEASAAADKPAS